MGYGRPCPHNDDGGNSAGVGDDSSDAHARVTAQAATITTEATATTMASTAAAPIADDKEEVRVEASRGDHY